MAVYQKLHRFVTCRLWLVVPDLLAWSPLVLKLMAILYGEITYPR